MGFADLGAGVAVCFLDLGADLRWEIGMGLLGLGTGVVDDDVTNSDTVFPWIRASAPLQMFK